MHDVCEYPSWVDSNTPALWQCLADLISWLYHYMEMKINAGPSHMLDKTTLTYQILTSKVGPELKELNKL